MGRVFISHSSKDSEVAGKICEALEKSGYSCWMAPRNIMPGQQWAEGIIEGIETSSIFVLVYSANSNNSSQVIREVERAVAKKIPIIPFRIEDLQPTKALEYFISSSHWLNALEPPLENHLRTLAAAIKPLVEQYPQTRSSRPGIAPTTAEGAKKWTLKFHPTEEHKEFLAQFQRMLSEKGYFENSINEATLILDELIGFVVTGAGQAEPDGEFQVGVDLKETYVRMTVCVPGNRFQPADGEIPLALMTAKSLAHRLEFLESGTCVEGVVLNKAEVVQEKLEINDGAELIGKVIVLKFKGYFDDSQGAELVAKVEQLIGKSFIKIVIDCDEITVINSSGMGKVLEAISLLEEENGRMVFANVSTLIRKMIKIFGTDLTFDSVDEAIENLKG